MYKNPHLYPPYYVPGLKQGYLTRLLNEELKQIVSQINVAKSLASEDSFINPPSPSIDKERLRALARTIFGIDPFFESQKKETVTARRAYIWALRKIGLRNGEIAREMGYDHATIIHHFRTFSGFIDTNSLSFAEKIFVRAFLNY